MSDCVTVSDATILYCSDDGESTLYATVGGEEADYSSQKLDSSPADGLNDYDAPQVLMDAISCSPSTTL